MNYALKIYDAMASHRRLCLLTFIAATLALIALALRLEFREDISDFLPLDERQQEQMSVYQQVSGASRVVAVFEGSDEPDVLVAAIECFVAEVERRDTARLVSSIVAQADVSLAEQTARFVYENIPYFLEPQDYRQMDSLLASEGYVARQLQSDREMLMLPTGGLLTENVERDPLQLFSPVMTALRQAPSVHYESYDGYIFTPDMRRAVVMLDSRFGGSETKGNARLLALLHECAHNVQCSMSNNQCPKLSVSFVGGPVIAVGNAEQIKADSLLSVSIAVVLILLLLYFSFRSLRHLLLIAVAIGWGALFALAALSLVHREVSLIVIGISSVIVGIAANYPLHLISHLRHTPDVRKSLSEIAKPLIVGNVTTVGAFLALVPLHSVALRDLGLFSAFLLIGTILFVLLWMPHFLNEELRMKNEEFSAALPTSSTVNSKFLHLTRRSRHSLILNSKFLILFLTLFFGYHSLGVSFDTDLTHINYISGEQKAAMASLGIVGEHQGQSEAHFLLADSIQQRRLTLWRDWTQRHRDELLQKLAAEAPQAGFAEGSFDAFAQLLSSDYRPQPLTYFRQLPPSLLLQNIDVRELNRTILNSLTDNFNYIGWACSLIVFLFLWFSFRSLTLAVIAFVPMAVSWVWILGIMSLCGIQFNIVNIILATFIFGQGDDYTIFMTEGAVYEATHRRPMLASYRRAILLSALIMFIGIGSLIVARHPALHSLAEVTIVGMASVVLMALVLPPVLYRELRIEN